MLLSRVGEYPFDSERKLMSVLYTQTAAPAALDGIDVAIGNKTLILCKGAPERVLVNSTHYLSPAPEGVSFTAHINASTQNPVTPQFQEIVSQAASRMAESGLRVLAMAYRIVSPESSRDILSQKSPKSAESNLVFVGLVGLIDPPKYLAML